MSPPNGDYFDLFGPIDASGRCEAETPKMIARKCVGCGAAFDAPEPKGRPRSFCSDECRHRSNVASCRAWQDIEDEPTNCAFCKRTLPRRDVSSGRFRRFCNSNCLKRARRGAEPNPDLPNLLSQPTEEKR